MSLLITSVGAKNTPTLFESTGAVSYALIVALFSALRLKPGLSLFSSTLILFVTLLKAPMLGMFVLVSSVMALKKLPVNPFGSHLHHEYHLYQCSNLYYHQMNILKPNCCMKMILYYHRKLLDCQCDF